jgi:hypothetical protein
MLPLRWPVVAVELRTEGRFVGLQSVEGAVGEALVVTTRPLLVARDEDRRRILNA